MIALDTNILVYAHREDSPFHQAAHEHVRALAEGAAPWAIPWPCLHEFLAIVTHPRIYAPPTPLDLAIEQVDAWTESPSLILLAESQSHWATLRPLLAAARVRGPQVHDARIAALCLQHEVQRTLVRRPRLRALPDARRRQSAGHTGRGVEREFPHAPSANALRRSASKSTPRRTPGDRCPCARKSPSRSSARRCPRCLRSPAARSARAVRCPPAPAR